MGLCDQLSPLPSSCHSAHERENPGCETYPQNGATRRFGAAGRLTGSLPPALYNEL
jgi:Cu/Zn superoxide dismutase